MYCPWTTGILLLLQLVTHSDGVYSPATETGIRTLIFGSYDKYARPSDQVTVTVSLSILAIDSLELKEQKLTSTGWLTIDWTDSRLVWVPASYGDIEYLYADPSVIWKPELVVDNAMDAVGVLSADNLMLKVKYDGTVEWEPPLLFITHCQVDITYYPYDLQKCGIELVSWGFTVDDVKLEHARTDVNLEDFETHGEWEISKSSVRVSNLTEHSNGEVKIFPLLDFYLYLERRTDFYNLNVMLPIILTSLLVVLVFVVPVDSGEKLSFILTVLLTLAVLLTITADSLPPTSITTSILGVYLCVVLLLATLAVLLTVLILILHHRTGTILRGSVVVKTARVAAKVTCTKVPGLDDVNESRVKAINSDNDNKSMTSNGSNEEIDASWPELAAVLDRCSFVCFLVITAMTNFSFFVAMAAGAAESDLD